MDVFSQSTTTTTSTLKPVSKKKKYSSFNHTLATLAAWFFLLIVTCVYYYFMIPVIVERFQSVGIVIVSVGVYLWLCTLGAMAMTMTMDPGIMPRATEREELFNLRLQGTNVNRKRGTVTITINGKNIYMKWCYTCHMFRPPRSSHCAVCDRCIETFDHHCPWVNNCIGRRNYKQYVILLLCANIHILILISFSLLYIISDTSKLNDPAHFVCYVYLIICVMALFVVGQLTFLHLKLVSRCQTTRERNTYTYSRVGGSPFRYGIMKNWFIAMCSPQYPTYTSYLPTVVDVNQIKSRSDIELKELTNVNRPRQLLCVAINK